MISKVQVGKHNPLFIDLATGGIAISLSMLTNSTVDLGFGLVNDSSKPITDTDDMEDLPVVISFSSSVQIDEMLQALKEAKKEMKKIEKKNLKEIKS